MGRLLRCSEERCSLFQLLLLGLVAVTSATIEFDPWSWCVCEGFSDFGIRGCEMVGSHDVDIACLVFLQIIQDVSSDIVNGTIARERDPRDRIIFNHVKKSCTDSMTAVFKNLFGEWGARLVSIDFGLWICQLGLRFDSTGCARILWRQSINSAS